VCVCVCVCVCVFHGNSSWASVSQLFENHPFPLLCLLAFKTAFDRVPREVIRWAMRKLGVEELFVSAVMSMYSGYTLVAFSALMLLVGQQERHLACKKLSGGMLAWLSGMRCRLAYSRAGATATHYLLLQ